MRKAGDLLELGEPAGTLRCGYCGADVEVAAEVLRLAKVAGSDRCVVCPPPSQCYRRWQASRDEHVAQRARELAAAVKRVEAGQEPPQPEWMANDATAQERLAAARRRRDSGNGEDPLA